MILLSAMEQIALICNQRMAQEALKVLAAHATIRVPFVVHHDAESGWRHALNRLDSTKTPHLVRCHNCLDDKVLAELRPSSPTLILSVGCFDIFKSPLPRIPRDSVINFHNGPLSDYRGINRPGQS